MLIIAGSAIVNESILTGESTPHWKFTPIALQSKEIMSRAQGMHMFKDCGIDVNTISQVLRAIPSFKRLADIDDIDESDEGVVNDEDWRNSKDLSYDTDDSEDVAIDSSSQNCRTHKLAANSCKGRIFGLQKIGSKKIPEHVRQHKQTILERAKATLFLATLPKSLPCRNKFDYAL